MIEFTQKEVLAALEKSNRKKWNSRQMTALREEGFLPSLRRRTRPGTNKPQFFWNEMDINQIVDVYDWWDYCDGARRTLALILWLEGYEVRLDLLHRIYIPFIEGYLQKLTNGKTDLEDILNEVSGIVLVWIRKLKYTPGLASLRRKMVTERNINLEQIEVFLEKMLVTLAVPDEFAAEILYSHFLDARESQDASVNYTEDEDFGAQFQNAATILRDIFSLQHLLEAINAATLEQWQQARKDYLDFCHVLGIIGKWRIIKGEESLSEQFLMGLKIIGARWLIIPLLSIRHQGYGQWIDKTFEHIHKFLNDPVIQERVLDLGIDKDKERNIVTIQRSDKNYIIKKYNMVEDDT